MYIFNVMNYELGELNPTRFPAPSTPIIIDSHALQEESF